jgi:hypothetical protein
MASPFATAFAVCPVTTVALDSSWLTLVEYAGTREAVEAGVVAAVGASEVENPIDRGGVEPSADGGIEGELVP